MGINNSDNNGASLASLARDSIFNYSEALEKSLLFYEAQRAGELPDDNQIAWRGDAVTNDGSDVGVDLSGGYFDAGDHVKFVFPMASSLTMLSWGVLEYREAYEQSNQLDKALETIKWGTDFLLSAHETSNGVTQALWGQVGDIVEDHSQWVPPEEVDNITERPSFKIDTQHPGSDLAAEVAAAMASASMIFRPTDPDYADKLLDNAVQLYNFADDADHNAANGKQRGKYSDSLWNPNGVEFRNPDGAYVSYSYEDELAWGAAWLHKSLVDAGNVDTVYLNQSKNYYGGLWLEGTQSWDSKDHGTAVLLSQLTGDSQYTTDVETWLDYWLPGGGISYTPGGLAWSEGLGGWGSLRYTANTAFLAGLYSDTVNAGDGSYDAFAERQVNYILGDNPLNFSYMIGFGDSYALQPHHRGAHGISGWQAYGDTTQPNINILQGALVGGPTSNDDFAYEDLRTNFQGNEVALDYNAGLTGALARLKLRYEQPPVTEDGSSATGYIKDGTLAGKVWNSGTAYAGNLLSNTDGTANPDDVLIATDGADNVWGGTEGSDTIYTEAGNDIVGVNTAAGGAVVDTGDGNDFVYSTNSANGLSGTGEINSIDLGTGQDSAWILNGNNRIVSNAGDNTIGLGTGGDTVILGNGNNVIYMTNGVGAADGAKDITTGSGNDWVQAGSGNDRIDLGTNAGGAADYDVAFGEAGSDTFVVHTGNGWLSVGDFAQGRDYFELPAGLTFEDLSQVNNLGSTWIWAEDDVLVELTGFTETLTAADFNGPT